MSIAETAALLGVGLAAGTINTIVGSGTLLSFPTLLAFGYSPVVANVTNTVGLVPGSVSGIHGYRQEVAEFRSSVPGPRLLRLMTCSLLGAITGALLLLVLPAGAFKAIVPALILTALVLVVVQPRLAARLSARRAAAEASGKKATSTGQGGWGVLAAVFGSGVYGGYFGAAQGVLLMAVLGLTYTDRLQVLNGVKNVLAAVVNGIAAVIFIIAGSLPGSGPDHPGVVWSAAVAIAVGAIVGGQVGARIGRRLPPTALRGLIIVVGLAAVVRMLV